jgi:Skp family chaperone for outer membrane proteins
LNYPLQKLLVISFMALALTAQAAELKVGYVQVDKILQEAPQTAESGKKLEREFSPRSQELDKMAKQPSRRQNAAIKNATCKTSKLNFNANSANYAKTLICVKTKN